MINSGAAIASRGDYEFQKSDEGYELMAADSSVLIDAARLRWNGDDLHGEITAYADAVGIVGPLSFVFTSASSRREMMTLMQDEGVGKALNEMCRHVIHAERVESSPVVRLRDVARPSPEREYAVPMLPPVPRHSMAIWFGDGGTGKSLLALYAAGCLAQQGLRVLYLDWELSAEDHRIRYEQLFGAEMPAAMHYWQCDRPLTQMVDSIRRTIRQMHIDYVVVDSIAFACGGNAESSEVAAQYGLAARSLGVGSLHLAHVPKSGDTHKPFGSAFWHNAARSTWYLEEKTTRPVAAHVIETTLQWSHRKANFGPKEKDARIVTFTIDAGRNQIRVGSEHQQSVSVRMKVADRVRQKLEGGRKSPEMLQAELPDVLPNTLNTTIRRELKKGKDGWLDEDRNGLLGLR